MGRDVFPCLRRILTRKGGIQGRSQGHLQLCLWLSPEDAQMHPVPRISGEKLEQEKEAERGQGSAYHEEELSEIHRFSDC